MKTKKKRLTGNEAVLKDITLLGDKSKDVVFKAGVKAIFEGAFWGGHGKGYSRAIDDAIDVLKELKKENIENRG